MKSLWLILCLTPFAAFAQQGLRMIGHDEITIPFTSVNGLILLPVTINGTALTFILDSGVGETLLFSLDSKDTNFNNIEKISFTGLGGDVSAEGLKSTHNTLKIADDFIDTNHTVYIILNEDFNFSSRLGVPVNGIIGYDFFKNYVVSINYITQRIKILPNVHSIKNLDSKYEMLPLTMERKKPYINAAVKIAGSWIPAKMLIDIGNSDELWLFSSRIPGFTFHSKTLYDYLGRGFNGDINGRRGRIAAVSLGSYVLNQPIVSVPDEKSIENITMSADRVGSVGSGILGRFHIIIDYPNKKFYFRKNKDFSEPFLFNMSGINVQHDGMVWTQTLVKMDVEDTANKANTANGTNVYRAPASFQYKFQLKPAYSIIGIRQGSPADEAGLQPGDTLVFLNGTAAYKYTLQGIYNVLSSKENRAVHIVVSRGGKEIRKSFILKDPIPYEE